MQLDLKDIIHVPEAKLDFDFPLDLSHLVFFDESPIQSPVKVHGCVTNHAGALVLQGAADTTLRHRCDRCGVLFDQEKSVPLDTLVAGDLQDEEHDEIILLQGTQLDMDQVATTAFVLALDTKKLCSDQCEGLCPSCGVNLNEEDCRCQVASDSPFAMLAQLLDD